MKPLNEQFQIERPVVIPENLTAVLTCLGAKTSAEDVKAILAKQNPYRQKRGGLGFGAYSIVQIPGQGSSFSNINIFNRQAETSSLTLRLRNIETGDFDLYDFQGNLFTSGKILPIPTWGQKILSTGKPAITVLQQHGPKNLVGVLDDSRCELFEKGQECKFCMMNGGSTNESRSVEEILEAFQLAREDKQAYNLTLTSGLQLSRPPFDTLLEQVAALKRGIGDTALALEIAPVPADMSLDLFRGLKDAGLDTLMVPLDVFDPDAQQRYIPGKASLLQENYFQNAENAVAVFGAGNVTSSIIVGLESADSTGRAIQYMVQYGVIPEPVPVRWDDSKLGSERMPLTAPGDLVAMRAYIEELIRTSPIRNNIQKTRAGCAACGGCGGIVVNNLKRFPIRSS